MSENIRIAYAFAVTPDGQLEMPGDISQALEPGTSYAICPLEDVRRVKRVVKQKRLFHLGDLALQRSDMIALARAGFWNSAQVLAAGQPGLVAAAGLSFEGFTKIVETFDGLGMPVPDRIGDSPARPGRAEFETLVAGYLAHLKVWELRKLLVGLADKDQATFVQHSEGIDIACTCGKQYLRVPWRQAAGFVCHGCGNDIGLDLSIEVEARRIVVKE